MKVVKALLFIFALQLIVFGIMGQSFINEGGEIGLGGGFDEMLAPFKAYFQYIPTAMIILGVVIILLCLFVGKKDKQSDGKSFKKPLATFPLGLLWIGVTFGLAYFITTLEDADVFYNVVSTVISFAYQYRWIVIIAFAVWGLVMTFFHKYYEQLDRQTNAVFTAGCYDVNWTHMFTQTFAPLHSKSPLVYCYDDLRIIFVRKLIITLNLLVKLLCSSLAYVCIGVFAFRWLLSGDLMDAVFQSFGANANNYLVTMVMLMCLPHLDELFYCITIIFPFYEITGYLVEKDTGRIVDTYTNVGALLALTLVFMAYSIFFYPVVCGNMFSRLIETDRFRSFIKQNGWADDIADYYDL